MAVSYVLPIFHAEDDAGRPLVGGKLTTFLSGTTTPAVTYLDAAGTPNTNPVTLNARGEARVFLDDAVSYTFVLKDWLGVTIWTQDGVRTAGGELASNLSAPGGSSLMGLIAAGAGAVATTMQEFARRKVWVADYLPAGISAMGLRSINCSPYAQTAIDAASPFYGPGILAGDVIFPDGVALRLDTPLDCTNSRVVGTRSRDGLHLVGNGVTLLGNTGPGRAIIEVTGSQFLEIDKGIRLVTLWTLSALPNKSTFGIFSGCSVILPQTQNQRISCRIEMHSDPTANGGVGTIAYYNFGSEENTYDNVFWFANVAAIFTSSNDGTQYGNIQYASYQAPLLGVHSLGVTTFAGECFLCGVNLRNSPLIVQNITGFSGKSLYISDVSPVGGSNVSAINVFGNTVAMDLKVTIEQYASVVLHGSVINSDIDIVWGAVIATAASAIVYDQASSNILKNSRVKVALQDSGSNTRAITGPLDGNFTGPCNYAFQNVEFIADALGAPNLFLPIGIAGNVATLGVKMTGANLNVYQPAFSAAYSGDSPAAVTGDGTVYDLNGYTMQSLFNANNSLNTLNGIFTAPQSGTYEFTGMLRLFGFVSGQANAQLSVVVNGIEYLLQRTSPIPIIVGNTAWLQGTRKVPMRANQPAFLRVKVDGPSKSIFISSGAGPGLDCFFEGAAVH